MDSCKLQLMALLAVLLLKTAIGTAATWISIIPQGVCVAPGDHIQLDCTLRAASYNDTRLSFYKGSVLVNNTNHDFPKLCRRRGSRCKWDLTARLTVDPASASDEDVYRCEAVQDGRPYTASATVFVQYRSEFQLPTSRVADLGESVTVLLDRKCDQLEPVSVTRTGKDGVVKVLPYRYGREDDRSAYVDKTYGALEIPNFKCTDAGYYNFTVMARRGFEPVSTSKSMYIGLNASCEGCCPEDATVAPTRKSTANTQAETTAVRGVIEKLGCAENNTAYIVVIVVLVSAIAGCVVMILYYRRKLDLTKRNQTEVNVEANDEADPLKSGPNYTEMTGVSV
ncbi:uncharacterized protein LOC119741160 isoform X3 [Patiria miniata]|nr:uncharacterized protein LOC119741160 isoform X3 [Patiria miniata]